MGVKTQISLGDLPLKYQSFDLIPTKNGISDTVYFLGDKFIVKIFEDKNYNLDSEIELLNYIKDLKVIQVVEKFQIDKKNSLIYKQIAGESILYPDISHIKQVGKFLKEFHSITKGKSSNNANIFHKNNIGTLINHRGNKAIQNYYNNISIDLKNDGIIHGDLFCDNVNFRDNKMTGVYDFKRACNGDFNLDLAICSVSWCYDETCLNEKKLEVLLESYSLTTSKYLFYNYIKYALLCIAALRISLKLNYDKILVKLDSLVRKSI